MDTKELTLKIASACGPSGAEDRATAVMAELLSPYGPVKVDRLGNLICSVRPAEGKERHYVLDAHSDEIGMIVTGITDEGFLKVDSVGGLDRRLLYSSELTVHGTEDLYGIVASTPPHLQGKEEKKNPKMTDIVVDIGLTKEQAREKVRLGDFITFRSKARELAGGFITCKALDDRSSCAAIIRAVELLKDVELDCGLTVAFAVQEEAGMAGAKTSCYPLGATHCFSLDVTFAQTPDQEPGSCTELKKGPSVVHAPLSNRKFTRRVLEVAHEKGIPVQEEAGGGGKTGTNADGIVVTGEGVAICCVGIPLAHMHTPVEVMHPDDIENTARLIAEYLKAEEGRK